MPRPLRRSFFVLLSRVVYLIANKRKKIIRKNFELAGLTLSEKEKVRISKACFANLFIAIMNIIEVHYYPKSKLPKLFRVKNPEMIEKLKQSGKGSIYFSTHYHSIDFIAQALNQYTNTLQVLEKANNPYIEAFLVQGREKYGTELVYNGRQSIMKFAKRLKAKKDISIIVDQSVDESNSIPIMLFGKETWHLKTASYLARKFDANLVPMKARMTEDYVQELEIMPPIEFTASEDEAADLHYLTQAQAHLLEEQIAEDPTPWFWCHKRWKHTYEGIYDNLV